MSKVLLCTDLDRTLVPNGSQPESPHARALFSRLIASNAVKLAYVSGRHLALIEQAIDEYQLPMPDFAVADVGSTIYRREQNQWQHWQAWDQEIAGDWQGMSRESLHALLADYPDLQLQEAEKQNTHKLSYYLPTNLNHMAVIDDIRTHLEKENIRANLIWSIDELQNIGLLDILPASVNKLHAITFLIEHSGFDRQHTIFAGDSGNDLDVLLSPIPSVLVANADQQVRSAVHAAPEDTLYIAQGDFLKMNGNYSAGILEGIAHYYPEFLPVMEAL